METGSDPGYLMLDAAFAKHPDLRDKPIFTAKEVGKLLHLNMVTVYAYIRRGTLKTTVMSGRYFVTPAQLREFCTSYGTQANAWKTGKKHISVDNPIYTYLASRYEKCDESAPSLTLDDIGDDVDEYLESIGEPTAPRSWIGRIVNALFQPRVSRSRVSRTCKPRLYHGIRRKADAPV